MQSTPREDRIEKVRLSPLMYRFLQALSRKGRESEVSQGAQLYFIGIPVIEDTSLTGTSWVLSDIDGHSIAEGGEPDGKAQAAS